MCIFATTARHTSRGFGWRTACGVLCAGFVLIALSGCGVKSEIETKLGVIEAKVEKTNQFTSGIKTKIDHGRDALTENQQTSLDALGVMYGDLAAFKSETQQHFKDVQSVVQTTGISDTKLGVFFVAYYALSKLTNWLQLCFPRRRRKGWRILTPETGP